MCSTDPRAPALAVWHISQFAANGAAMLQELQTTKIVYECLSEFGVMRVPRILRGCMHFVLLFLSRQKLVSVYRGKYKYNFGHKRANIKHAKHFNNLHSIKLYPFFSSDFILGLRNKMLLSETTLSPNSANFN